MLRRVRPTNAWDWASRVCCAFAAVLLTWSMVAADWWSTAIALNVPFSPTSSQYGGTSDLGRTLIDGYPWLAIGLIALMFVGIGLMLAVLGPFDLLRGTRYMAGSLLIGTAGIAITMLMAWRLESPFVGLAQTNGWIPATLGWIFYFSAFGAGLPARGPRLEFETRPDSSDG